ncbi:MAG TPA: caspase family protein [Burkholderiaceae bacterium]|nr:caspase family protein [Burkholderiaceae bacterium]
MTCLRAPCNDGRCPAWLGSLLLAVALLAVQGASAQATRGVALTEVTEDRLALVIGNAAYRISPLDNPVNDARLIGSQLEQAGFKVLRYENLDRNAMTRAMREFGDRLTDRTIAVFYYAGHALQLRDRNFLVPIEAEIRNEDEIEMASVDVGFILGRMASAHSRINIVILDACRNNPFAGKTRPAHGLAQMEAPVGTLLAFATAPGKVSEDGVDTNSQNSLYTAQIAKYLLTPGLPVETLFKRVREAVVRGTNGSQVPWENSSLLGEFAFVPGVAQASKSTAEDEVAGEVAFWNSIQDSTRAEEYRAYLRQYPRGRFVALAQTRIAALAPAPPVSAPAAPGASPLPHVGDTWRYRIQDRYMLGDLFVTTTVDDVTDSGVAETWTSTFDGKVRSTFVPLKPGFRPLPGLEQMPPEFAPYLQAAGLLRPGQRIGDQQRRIEQVEVALKSSVASEEDVVVQAGRFRAIKLVLSGQARGRSASQGPISTEQTIWYAPEVKRIVKYSVSTKVAGLQQEATQLELIEYTLH